MIIQSAMHAIILAAGRGSRLKELTQDRPKCMVELLGKPLIQWQLVALRGAGIIDIAVVRGYRGDQIITEELSVFENPSWEHTNMVCSLLAAREWLRTFPCVVSYADIVYPTSTIASLKACADGIAITSNTRWRELWEKRFPDPLADVETFRVDEQGLLLDIGSRAKSLDEIQGQYMGLLKFTPSGWQMVEEYLKDFPEQDLIRLDVTGLLQGLLARGTAIRTTPIDGKWLEVDSKADLDLYASNASLWGKCYEIHTNFGE